jgi:hypothetical protein
MMNTNSNKPLKEFHVLCERINDLEASYSPALEAGYESLLEFLERESGDRRIFAIAMIDSVGEYKNARSGGEPLLSIDAMAFCMHRLRWDEVLEAAKRESDQYFVPRADSMLVRLIDAFDDDWREAADYRVFRVKS